MTEANEENIYFHCPFCPYYSENLINLKKHIARQHVEPYCRFCGREFKNIRKHFLNEGIWNIQHAMMYFLTTHSHKVRNRSAETKHVYQRGQNYYMKHFAKPKKK